MLSFGYLLKIYCQEKSGGRSAHYKLTSTVMLWLQTSKQDSGTMNLGGSLTRQVCLIITVILFESLISIIKLKDFRFHYMLKFC